MKCSLGTVSFTHKKRHIVQRQNRKPEWLESFLVQPYFTSCHLHSTAKKTLINLFCIDCKTSVCSQCLQDFGHKEHMVIKTHKHFHQHVVRATDIEPYMNIDSIRTYIRQEKKVIYLQFRKEVDLPANASNHRNKKRTSNKSSGQSRKGRVNCKVCGRGLEADPSVYYCSIQCKLAGYTSKSEPSASPFLALNTGEQRPEVQTEKECNNVLEEPQRRRRKRKGIPRRAAL
uniref:B box-type domain-containing protein n=1 Tax=Kalanchoe fedtschenkoi TaxID=63787 RepID=A0A7N0UUW5_KALFE